MSKHGDFRAPFNGRPHRISVNRSLNPYAFLITFLHEIAHLIVWETHGRKVKSHGIEWKSTFGVLLQEYIEAGCFPEDLEDILMRHALKPRASSSSDQKLLMALRSYDDAPTRVTLLEELQENALFALPNGRIFRKGKKRRTRYLCQELSSRRAYTISQLAEVKLILPDPGASATIDNFAAQ